VQRRLHQRSVHDPSVIKTGDTWYVFGSHLAAAKTTDLMNWTKLADGVNNANPLFTNVHDRAVCRDLRLGADHHAVGADVIKLDDGKFYLYYNACKGDSPRSALGVAVADKIEGPYVNKKLLLKSGMWGEPAKTARSTTRASTRTWSTRTPVRQGGKLWMVYGSYSGGIFIMAMDKTTGLPLAGQGYGKHLLGGNHSRIEGAYVLYSPDSQYYYLFTSFGGLDAAGAYNVRVARSRNPDGPVPGRQGHRHGDRQGQCRAAAVRRRQHRAARPEADGQPPVRAAPARPARAGLRVGGPQLGQLRRGHASSTSSSSTRASLAVARSTRSACTRCSSTRTAGPWWRRCAMRRCRKNATALSATSRRPMLRALPVHQSRQGYYGGHQERAESSSWGADGTVTAR
jgi:hypothetical protein